MNSVSSLLWVQVYSEKLSMRISLTSISIRTRFTCTKEIKELYKETLIIIYSDYITEWFK